MPLPGLRPASLAEGIPTPGCGRRAEPGRCWLVARSIHCRCKLETRKSPTLGRPWGPWEDKPSRGSAFWTRHVVIHFVRRETWSKERCPRTHGQSEEQPAGARP